MIFFRIVIFLYLDYKFIVKEDFKYCIKDCKKGYYNKIN